MEVNAANEISQYRHKKFDNFKRKRYDSSNSSHSNAETFESSSVTTENLSNSDHKGSCASRTNLSCDRSLTIPPSKKRSVTSSPCRTISPVETLLPRLNDEMLSNIYKYHANMVRKFPKKERSPKDQKRRDKNTIACRMSRRSKKLEQLLIEEQYREFSEKNFAIEEQTIRANAYLIELNKLISLPRSQLPTLSTECPAAIPPPNIPNILASPTSDSKGNNIDTSPTRKDVSASLTQDKLRNNNASKLSFTEETKVPKKPFTIAYLIDKYHKERLAMFANTQPLRDIHRLDRPTIAIFDFSTDFLHVPEYGIHGILVRFRSSAFSLIPGSMAFMFQSILDVINS
uniref:BZIP domain-containing protein n=1 Tax=Glossina austeni TaxID=7395 RepID=A0A1A9VIU9_GLOAU